MINKAVQGDIGVKSVEEMLQKSRMELYYMNGKEQNTKIALDL
jgi:translation initiation factor IF-1